jgi:hypothetical protein
VTVAVAYPLDGPHAAATIVQACRDVEHVVHYLCRATRHPTILGNPADAAQAVAALREATIMLFQLFDQLAQAADRWAGTPGLYDYRHHDPQTTATDVGLHLRGAAAASLTLATRVGAAHEAVSRLGINPPKENP